MEPRPTTHRLLGLAEVTPGAAFPAQVPFADERFVRMVLRSDAQPRFATWQEQQRLAWFERQAGGMTAWQLDSDKAAINRECGVRPAAVVLGALLLAALLLWNL